MVMVKKCQESASISIEPEPCSRSPCFKTVFTSENMRIWAINLSLKDHFEKIYRFFGNLEQDRGCLQRIQESLNKHFDIYPESGFLTQEAR